MFRRFTPGGGASSLCIGFLLFSLTGLPGPGGLAGSRPAPDASAPAVAPPSSPLGGDLPGTAADPPPAAVAEPPAPKPAPSLTAFDPSLGAPRTPYGELIYEVASRHGVNAHLVAAIIRAESSFNPRAVSHQGACGLMQLLPETGRRFGLRQQGHLFDPRRNLDAGVRYLKWLSRRYDGDVQRVLAAYNAGEGAVDRYDGVPPYRETRRYLARVLGVLAELHPPVPGAGGTPDVVAAAR
jgi:soluble lytic murein transglycosylase-like protein